MKKALLIAFHFPPMASSSGYQRTLRFAEYLPDFGWTPIVLTVTPGAYPPEEVDPASSRLVPKGCRVVRVPCLNAARHLAVRGRYPGVLSIPDRWASWALLGGIMGRRLCRSEKADLVWSTYPIATAHRIGARVARGTGLPWVADFRDPMMHHVYPSHPVVRACVGRIESVAAHAASKLLFTTASALSACRGRYPDVPASRFGLLENGYDEATFCGQQPSRAGAGRPLLILHSGIVYPVHRDPGPLFSALGALKQEGAIRSGDFVIRFRAPVHESMLRNLAAAHAVEAFIEVAAPLPYPEAIAEMLSADGLLLLQAAVNREQIPAKLYEYLRAQRPLWALADPSGDTGRLLTSLGFDAVVPLESVPDIRRSLVSFLTALRSGQSHTLAPDAVDRFSRRSLTRRLAGLFDEVSGARAGPVAA